MDSLCPSHSFLFFASWSVVFQLLAAYSQRWRKKMELNLLFEVLGVTQLSTIYCHLCLIEP